MGSRPSGLVCPFAPDRNGPSSETDSTEESTSAQLLTLVQKCQAKRLSALHSTEFSKAHTTLRHDHFLLEAAGGHYQQKTADGEERQGIEPELGEAGAAENDAARDVDVIAGGDEIAEDVEKCGHGFAREDVPRKDMLGEEDGDFYDDHQLYMTIG